MKQCMDRLMELTSTDMLHCMTFNEVNEYCTRSDRVRAYCYMARLLFNTSLDSASSMIRTSNAIHAWIKTFENERDAFRTVCKRRRLSVAWNLYSESRYIDVINETLIELNKPVYTDGICVSMLEVD